MKSSYHGAAKNLLGAEQLSQPPPRNLEREIERIQLLLHLHDNISVEERREQIIRLLLVPVQRFGVACYCHLQVLVCLF